MTPRTSLPIKPGNVVRLVVIKVSILAFSLLSFVPSAVAAEKCASVFSAEAWVGDVIGGNRKLARVVRQKLTDLKYSQNPELIFELLWVSYELSKNSKLVPLKDIRNIAELEFQYSTGKRAMREIFHQKWWKAYDKPDRRTEKLIELQPAGIEIINSILSEL